MDAVDRRLLAKSGVIAAGLASLVLTVATVAGLAVRVFTLAAW